MKRLMEKTGFWLAVASVLWSGTVLGLFARNQQDQAGQQTQQQSQQDQEARKKKKKDQENKDKNAPGNTANNPPGNTPPAKPASGGDKPAPLFGGTINVKSSRQTKDSATLGFNGVDPNGQVQKSFLSASASSSDAAKAQQLGSYKVEAVELDSFLQDGGLNTQTPPVKANN